MFFTPYCAILQYSIPDTFPMLYDKYSSTDSSFDPHMQSSLNVYIYIYTCDWACENRSYLHVKFDIDFKSLKYNNFLFVICIVSKMCGIIYAEIHEEFNKINRFWIAHTEQKICTII